LEDSIKERDDLADRFKRKEDYWSSLYIKMFTAAQTNKGLAALFRTEGAEILVNQCCSFSITQPYSLRI
jgi:hypothetical protein